jgi:hypothetical protein
MQSNKKISTIFINNDTSNPISVDCTVVGEKENGMWSWSIENITRIGLVVSDKEEIDITKQIFSNKRALALITSQAASEEDQCIDILTDEPDVNPIIEEKKDSLFEMACNITRAHAKAFYGIDLNGKGGAE